MMSVCQACRPVNSTSLASAARAIRFPAPEMVMPDCKANGIGLVTSRR